MADVLGMKWRLDLAQELYNAVNDVLSSLTGKGNPSGTACIDKLCMHTTEVTVSSYKAVTGKTPSSDGPNMPVTNVSYNDAKAYCEKVHMRLPTGAEWEKFAGPNEFATADGKLVDNTGKKEANYDSSGPMNVKSFLPNSHGMYDMTGNVWEWVSDGSVFKDLRGGSWYRSNTDYLRVAYRNYYIYPGDSSRYVGFRCVSPEDSKK